MKNLRKLVTGGLVLGMLCIAAPRSEALTITLQDNNSLAQIDLDNPDPSQVGMNLWVVDGVNQLFQQWFWYRIGDNGGEAPINTLGGLVYSVSNADLDPGNETATIRYSNGSLQVDVQYTLTGNSIGSDSSQIAESITLKNLTTQTMQLHFFQYSDFDLGATPDDDSVAVVSQYKAVMSDGDGNLSEIVGSTLGPIPSHYSADATGVGPYDTHALLNDINPTTLNDQAFAGPGDVTWAFQWDLNIAGNGGTVSIGKLKSVGVPEPASLVLFGMSLLGVAGVARRRKALGAPQA